MNKHARIDKLLDDPRWQAVLDRKTDADGTFVYAISTTGIYCRPTCPSRRPKPEHTQIFDHPRQAETAGYRPCLRCLPQRQETMDALALGADEGRCSLR